MTVIVAMVVLAVRAVHMWRRSWRWRSRMAVRMRGCAVGAAFGFKSFIDRVDDEVHGAQQVGSRGRSGAQDRRQIAGCLAGRREVYEQDLI